MTEEELDKLIKGNAYKIFVAELAKHLHRAQAIFESGVPSDTEFIQVGASFHTIRGGAGFFGLSDLADRAGKIERILLGKAGSPAPNVSEVKSLIAQVDEMARSLPPPAS